MTFSLGAHPSPDDPRDHILTVAAIQSAAAGIILPDRFLVSAMPPHLNQNGYPTCTTHAGNEMKRWQEKKDGHGVRNYDQPRMYQWQKQIDGIVGDGSTGRAWCEVARTRGIPLKGMATGVDKIAGYWRVDIGVTHDWDALRAAVVTFGPIMVGMEFYNSWFHPVRGVAPAPSGGVAGGHEMLIVGYDLHLPGLNDMALCDWNSWGAYAGSTGGGNFWMPMKYVSTTSQAGRAQVWELWKTKDITGD